MTADVIILMGSDSDLPLMQPALDMLKKFGIRYHATVSSAHRTPERTVKIVKEGEANGVKVFICAAGGAAHLAGVVASKTIRPVIGVPLDSSPLDGIDALMSTAQMPPGIPVATVSIGKWGAANAAILAAQIIGVADEKMTQIMRDYKEEMARKVEEKAEKLQQQL
jgi:phosphoribosylaminoimidazole carboxylase PurE protein